MDGMETLEAGQDKKERMTDSRVRINYISEPDHDPSSTHHIISNPIPLMHFSLSHSTSQYCKAFRNSGLVGLPAFATAICMGK